MKRCDIHQLYFNFLIEMSTKPEAIPSAEDLTFESLHVSATQQVLSSLAQQMHEQGVLRDQVKSEVMQEVKDRPTFSEMIQFFFDKAKGMSTQPPFLSVHIEAVRRVTSVLEAKFEETVATLQRTAALQSEQLRQSVELVDSAHEGMVAAVRKVGRKTERHARLLKGLVNGDRRKGAQGRLFAAWKGMVDREKQAKAKLKEITSQHDSKVVSNRLHKWRSTALLALAKSHSSAIQNLSASSEDCASRLVSLDKRQNSYRVDSLTDSKASTTALKQVLAIAEQRDYSSFLKDIFEYISVQVKQMTSVRPTQGLETSKEYVDKQCQKMLHSLTERLDRFERSKEDTRVDTLERVMESARLQNTLLAERLNKLDYLIRVEDSEFKVSLLCQQIGKLEVNVDRLKNHIRAQESLQRSLTPVPVPKRPSTVGQTRPRTRSPPRPLEVSSALSLPSPPHQTLSLILGTASPPSPAKKPTGRATAQVKCEIPTPTLPPTGPADLTPVNARRSWERRGRVRSGKPYADARVQNRRLLDDMVIFSARLAAP